jgi:predicted small lipoprotein YifL
MSTRRRYVLHASVLAIALAGCGRRAPNATPDGAVRELVERMRQLKGDPADAKAAYDLLSKRAQQNLALRAKRYSDASGKAIAPEAMLAPARFLLRFEPQRYTAQVSGTLARVDVAGLRPDDRAQILAVFEDGGWHIDLAIPPLPPVQMRPGSGQP